MVLHGLNWPIKVDKDQVLAFLENNNQYYTISEEEGRDSYYTQNIQ